MKKSLFLILALALSNLTSFATEPSSMAGISSYQIGSLSSVYGGLGAYYNPASLARYDKSFEVDYFGSIESDDHVQNKNSAVFMRFGRMGLGVIHSEYGSFYNDDYQLGFGFGNKDHSFGFSYGWSESDDEFAHGKDLFTYSGINNINRWFSMAERFQFEMGKDVGYSRFTLEESIAFRPFTDRLTLFLDGSYTDKTKSNPGLDRTQIWAGLDTEPLDGLKFSVRRNLETDDMLLGATVYWRGFGLGGMSSQEDLDSGAYGDRYRISLSTRDFNNVNIFKPKPKLYARLNLSGMAGDYEWFIYGTKFTLTKFFKQMDHAQNDPRVKGLLIDWKPDFSTDPATLYEIYQRVKEFKDSGREIVFYCHSMGWGSMYLASLADRRAMLPIGEMEFSNLGGERLYLADMLSEMGLDYQRYNVGAYKGAGEELDSNSMSPEVRENVGRALRELYDTIIDTSRENYGFSHSQMEDIEKRWFITHDEMLEFGLIDTLLYDDKVSDWVCHRADSDDENSGSDFSINLNLGFGGDKNGSDEKLVALGSLAPKTFKRRWGDNREIAVIHASGAIMSGESIGPFIIGDKTLVSQLKSVRQNDAIKAVVLHINSPGGSGYASDLIWREIQLLKEKKPFFVSQGFLAASGGYYLSMLGDTINTTPMTITGSIGVAAGMVFNDGLFENAKLHQDGVWAGKQDQFGGAVAAFPLTMDAGSVEMGIGRVPVRGRKLTDYQHGEINTMITGFYKDFVTKVADGRDKEYDEIHAIAEGRIWSGPTSIDNGLTDNIAGLRETIEMAKDRIGKSGKDVGYTEIYPHISLGQLFSLLSGGINAGFENTKQQMYDKSLEQAKAGKLSIQTSGKAEMMIDSELFDIEVK
jgi:protease IV